jgi:hypothetical protein
MNNRHNIESYRNMGTYFGVQKCAEMPGINTLATGPVKEGFDNYNCNVVVPSELAMSYGKVFNNNPNGKTYNGYAAVADGYWPGQANCAEYRLRPCN